MATNIKKLLSLVLVMIMVLSMIPAVSATETDEEVTETPAATEPAATEPATEPAEDAIAIATADEWHTLTIEREDISKTSNINVYLDGELVLTWSSSRTTTALSHMKIAAKDKTEKVTIHFDNVYFGSAKEE